MGCSVMIIRDTNFVTILHDDIELNIAGDVKLQYNDSLTVIVNSIPVLTFHNVSIKDIASDITIELI